MLKLNFGSPCQGVSLGCLSSEVERFYYDQSTWTGVHKRGGPDHRGAALGIDGYADLSALIRRGHVQNDALQRKLAGRSRSGSPGKKSMRI